MYTRHRLEASYNNNNNNIMLCYYEQRTRTVHYEMKTPSCVYRGIYSGSACGYQLYCYYYKQSYFRN